MPLPEPLASCPDCMKDYTSQPFMLEALASVGIEHNKGIWEMARSYYTYFHARGHKDRGESQTC